MSNADQFECIDPEIGEMLPAHAEGTLGGADRQLFAAHLKACARCADEERVMREVARGIASLRVHPDPAAAAEPSVGGGRSRSALLLAAAIGAAAVLAGWLVTGPTAAPDTAVADVHALAARVQHLESQNAVLARSIAQERARFASSPLAGIPIASPPNL